MTRIAGWLRSVARAAALAAGPLLAACLGYAWASRAPGPPAATATPLEVEDTHAPDERFLDGGLLYLRNCVMCHGLAGHGDGPAAKGMFPRPRDFVRADYKIRSTPHGQLPTDEDLFRAISRGLPGTAMPGWEKILKSRQRWQLVGFLKSLSPRFETEKREPLSIPSSAASAERGERIYRSAKCALCHGHAGRGDGGIATTLYFEWGLPYPARDLTSGRTFRGGHDPGEIYLRITGGLNGTPMGPYADYLTDEERWDLAHYVAGLDRSTPSTPQGWELVATFVRGDLPETHDAPLWETTRALELPLAGPLSPDAPLRWSIPTVTACTIRALHDAREIAFLVEWNDPTGNTGTYPDSAHIQFSVPEGTENYVFTWRWRGGDMPEEGIVSGGGGIDAHPALFRALPLWKDGRWHVIFRRGVAGGQDFAPGKFIPVLFSVADGSNAEHGGRRARSFWIWATLEAPPGATPWLSALTLGLGMLLVELWILFGVRS